MKVVDDQVTVAFPATSSHDTLDGINEDALMSWSFNEENMTQARSKAQVSCNTSLHDQLGLISHLDTLMPFFIRLKKCALQKEEVFNNVHPAPPAEAEGQRLAQRACRGGHL